MAKSPDECTRNIVRIAGGIFLIYLITLLYSYRLVPLSWAIWLLSGVGFILVILIFVYFKKYHDMKKANIVPIKNTIRDLKELKAKYEKTENENIKKAMEACWEKLVKQMIAYLEPEKQYIWVITKGYHGTIGQVEKHTDANHVFFSNAKGVYIIPSSEVSLDLSEIEYVEGIQDLKGFHKQYGTQKPKKSWLKALFEKL